MKISRAWLQNYFEATLPPVAALAEALTFHAFEIEDVAGDVLDVKVLPNRAADSLSHRGVAKELGAILALPLKTDGLRAPLPTFAPTDQLVVAADPAYVLRHTGALVRGVKVGPSPEWLKTALESVGQRSINNVVDVLNYVMLDIGQPSGAFDAGKLVQDAGVIKIDIRRAKVGERIKVLTGEEYALTENMFAFTDAVGGALLDIAGIKGGLDSGVTEATTDLFLSAGIYDPVLIRKASQALKLFTDASQRYQNAPSPELTAYGMRDILALIQQVAGGEVVGVVDYYPKQELPAPVSSSLTQINGLLGSAFTIDEVKGVFDKLGFATTQDGETLSVTAPFERRDIKIPEDLAEEVGQILGYERIAGVELAPSAGEPDQAKFRGIERIKDLLIEHGYSEISTQSFAKAGETYLANPLDVEKPALRAGLAENMQQALTRGAAAAPRVLGPAHMLKLFEIGTVFAKDSERLSLALGYAPLTGKKSDNVLTEAFDALNDLFGPVPEAAINKSDGVLEIDLSGTNLEELGKEYEPRRVKLGAYRPFSIYPFALRDVAVWAPLGTEPDEVEEIIFKEAGDLLARLDLFDRFEKEGKLSYAFRLVFEAFDRTLTDVELVEIMDRVTTALNSREAFSVR